MVRQAMICYMDCVHVGVEGIFFLTCPLFDFDFELRLKNMGEKNQENPVMGYSVAYPTCAARGL